MTSHRRTGLMAKLRNSRLLKSAAGNAGVEFALIAPFLIALVAGSFDFGRGFIEQKRMASAAQAGAQYAFQHAFEVADPTGNTAPVEQAVRNDASDTANALTIVATYFCECSGTTSPCGTPCGSGEMPELYINVDVARDLDLMFSYPGIADPMPLSRTVTMRLR